MVKKPQKFFYANKKRVKSLKFILSNHSEIYINAKVKNHIIRAFRFKNNSAFIELYDKKTETITEFIKKLENFFFVEDVYFYPEPKDSKIIGVIILSRFKILLDIGVRHAAKCKGQFGKVPELAWILFGTPFKSNPPSQEKVKDLQTILTRYQDLVDDGYFIEDVLKAFTSKKPVTSITLSNINPKILNQLQKELRKYFFVRQGFSDPDDSDYGFSGELFVSLHKDLVDIMVFYSIYHFGTYDLFAGLAGVMLLDILKFPPQKIASYCFDERLKELNIIK